MVGEVTDRRTRPTWLARDFYLMMSIMYSILVILGASPRAPWLRSRLDLAMKVILLLRPDYIVVTGGDPSGLGVTEASIMEEHLVDHGVDEDRILSEETSLRTIDNAVNTEKLLRDTLRNVSAGAGPGAGAGAGAGAVSLYVLTSDFHAERSELLFRKVFPETYSIRMIPARTRLPGRTYLMLCEHEQKYIRHMREAGDLDGLVQTRS